MDQELVRRHAQEHCAALLAGDFDRAATDLSNELRSNLGSLISLMPLPLTAATVDSIEAGGSSVVAVLRLVGESETTLLETRWKERDGKPTIVEASHTAAPPEPTATEEEAGAEGPSSSPRATGRRAAASASGSPSGTCGRRAG